MIDVLSKVLENFNLNASNLPFKYHGSVIELAKEFVSERAIVESI